MAGPVYADKPSPELIQKHQLDLDAGWLGKFFGGGKAPTNIAGIISLLLVVAGVILPFLTGTPMSAEAYWTKVGPVVTLALGYLFGKQR